MVPEQFVRYQYTLEDTLSSDVAHLVPRVYLASIINISFEHVKRPGSKVIKLFTCSTQLGTKFILLINIKMPTIAGILTFISRINHGCG